MYGRKRQRLYIAACASSHKISKADFDVNIANTEHLPKQCSQIAYFTFVIAAAENIMVPLPV